MKMQKVSFGDLNVMLRNKDVKGDFSESLGVSQANDFHYIVRNKMDLEKVENRNKVEHNGQYAIEHCDNCDGFNIVSTPKTEKELFAKLQNAGIHVEKFSENKNKVSQRKSASFAPMDEFKAEETSMYADMSEEEKDLLQEVEEFYDVTSDEELELALEQYEISNY